MKGEKNTEKAAFNGLKKREFNFLSAYLVG